MGMSIALSASPLVSLPEQNHLANGFSVGVMLAGLSVKSERCEAFRARLVERRKREVKEEKDRDRGERRGGGGGLWTRGQDSWRNVFKYSVQWLRGNGNSWRSGGIKREREREIETDLGRTTRP